jgi:hypothetical protein
MQDIGVSDMTTDLQQSIFIELADFLVSQPSLESLANYRVSSATQQYIDTLIEKNRDGTLTADERLEMEKILAVSHVMTLTKTKAQLKLAGKI